MADHLHLPTHVLFDPGAASSGVAIVDPHLLHAGKLALDWLQQQRDALSILDISTMHDHFEEQAQRIDQQMSFPAGELSN
jgi:hypothetical protein